MKTLLQWLSPRNLRIAGILVPWLIAAVYLYGFAADRYVSESMVAVRSNSETPAVVSGLSALFPAAATPTRPDSLTLRSYMASTDMLRELDRQLGLRKAYSAPSRDWWFRLSSTANFESFLDYYRDRIDVQYDDDSGLMTLRTEAFDPQFAARLNRTLLELSERFINETSHRIAREQMAFAEAEQHRAQDNLERAKLAVQTFQNEHGVLDPLAQAQANTGLTVDLQAALAKQEAELKGMLGFMNPTAPQVQAQRVLVEGIRAQLEDERKRGTASGSKLNALAGDYQALATRLLFAEDAYKVATAGLENARIESVRKLKTLVQVQSPLEPERAEEPRRAYTLLALFLGLCLAYGIVRLVVATIEDHLG